MICTSEQIGTEQARLHDAACWSTCKVTDILAWHLTRLTLAFISPQVMVPSRRLATLLDQARRHQMADCMYHDDLGAVSLYKDHECASGEFPSLCTHILADHTDEVWRIEWSPDGMMLASAGKDQTVVIWQLKVGFLLYLESSADNKIIDGEDGTVRYGIDHLHILSEHRHPIDAMAWSPNGRTLVVGADKNVYIWDIKTGKQKSNSILPSPHLDVITAVRWLPDGSGFVVASHDFKVVFYVSLRVAIIRVRRAMLMSRMPMAPSLEAGRPMVSSTPTL